MKIKLMIVALAVVSGLQGSDRGQVVSTKDSAALEKALESCIESRSYAFTDRKRPVVVCCLQEINDNQIANVATQEAIDKMGRAIEKKSYQLTYIKTPTQNNDRWDNRHIPIANRVTLCAVYSIGDRVTKEDLLEINSLVNESPRTPFLIVATSSNLKSACQVVEADTASFNVEFSAALLESAKELAINEIDTVLNRNESLEDLLKTSEKLSVKTKFFQFNNNEKKPVGYISVFSKFFTNHWGKLAGVSLVAFLACYYYKVAH